MIEETARIIEVQGDFAWVETQRTTTCGSCSANKGCGTAVLAKVLGTRRTRIKVLNTFATKTGEEVIIGLHENALVQGSLAVYAVPLLAMLIFALVGEVFNARLSITQTEGMTIFFGLAGLAGGFLWLRHYAASISKDTRYQPVILRRVTSPLMHVASAHIVRS
jgi:sigma-E factor negative regulatory protein RseC